MDGQIYDTAVLFIRQKKEIQSTLVNSKLEGHLKYSELSRV